MRIKLVSDLHLEFDDHLTVEWTGEDVLVVAGDLSPDPQQAAEWLARYRAAADVRAGRLIRVVVCLGNHDYYGDRSMAETDRVWAADMGDGVDVLIDSSVVIDGVRFHGATMWTDFTGDERAMVWGIADFQCIPGGTLYELRRRHQRSRTHLALALGESAEPVVVVTHHLPTWDSVAPQYRGSDVQGGFASTDLGGLVGQAALWFHGHTHTCVDTVVEGTRVVCNPRGYCEDGPPENPQFDPGLIVELLQGSKF
jgi:3',5'-cyclic AMP phosphodiesterase CpdA